MKKIIVTLFLAAFLFVGNVAADSVGENFEAGGIQFGGSGFYYNNLDGYSSFSINPFLNFFVVDNLSLGVSAGFYTNSNSDMNFNVDGNIAYSIVADPSASTGFVGQVSLGLGYYRDITNSYGYFHATPLIRALYYISPRVAPYIGFEAVSFYFDEFGFTMDTYLRFTFGVAFSLPTKDKVIGAR